MHESRHCISAAQSPRVADGAEERHPAAANSRHAQPCPPDYLVSLLRIFRRWRPSRPVLSTRTRGQSEHVEHLLIMESKRLSVTWKGDAAAVMLNRPERGNALDEVMVEELLDVLERVTTKGCSILTFTGAGKHFCTGFDLEGIEGQSDGDLLLRFVRVELLLQALHHAPFPILCFAHGRNFGAGVDILLACSDRIADPSARFRMPGWRFGLALGTRRLNRRIGHERARAILRDATEFTADDAKTWGAISEIVPKAEWFTRDHAITVQWETLERPARERLLRMTVQDTRAEDIADLVASAARPGLKARITQYGAQRRTQPDTASG